MPTPEGFDPSTYNSSSVGIFTLGAVYEYAGRLFRYVRLDNTASSTNAAANGDCFAWTTTSAYYVSNIVAGSGSSTAVTNNPPAGVAVGVITAGNYGFILVKGRHTAVKSDGSTTAGLAQKISTTSTQASDQTSATLGTLGRALTADTGAGTTFVMDVDC